MTEPDSSPHFGPEEQMLDWCASEGITPVRDEDGAWDWHAAWSTYLANLGEEPLTDEELP